MPLLVCPNCEALTQAVRRHQVEFDMCPQCRGIWMDRGELEKVLEVERQSAIGANAHDGRGDCSWLAWVDKERRRDPRRRGRNDDGRIEQRHRRRSILDFFD